MSRLAPPAAEDSRSGHLRATCAPRSSEDLDALLADAEAKRDEYLDLARRAQADFENYRKRMAAEVQAAALRGKAEVARGVVPVLDDLERALQAAGLDPEGDSEDPLAHGVLLVFRNLRETLQRTGSRSSIRRARSSTRTRTKRSRPCRSRAPRRASWSR